MTSGPLRARATVMLTALAASGALMGAIADAQQRDARAVVPVGTAIIAGIVTVDADRAPLRRALVTMSGTGVIGRTQVVTDDGGRFVFADLAAGRYTLTAEKPGYVTTFYGSKLVGKGPGMPVALGEGQRVTDLTMSLLRGAVIAGTVRDEHGAPISSAQVQALLPILIGGERKLVDPPGAIPRATTDDRGRYRIYGLPPGDYTIRASGGSGLIGRDLRLTTAADVDAAIRELRGTASTPSFGDAGRTTAPAGPAVTRMGAYFPGMTDPGRAEFFTLTAGEERTGIDVRNPLVRAATIDGTMIGPSGQPLTNASVGIADASAGSLFSSAGAVRPDASGHFVIPSLPPARYLLFGRAADGAAAPVWAELEVLVSEQDLAGVMLPFLPGATVTGRVAFAGTAPPPDLAGFRIALTPMPRIGGTSMNAVPVAVRPDGAFTFTSVQPGRYGVSMSGEGLWKLRSAMVNGRDVLDEPLELTAGQNVTDVNVTFTDQPSQISGTLFDQIGRPTPDYTVVVFSTNRSHWLSPLPRTSRAVKLGSDGTYRIVGLPPGEYYLAALTSLDPVQVTDPLFLEQLVSASLRITLAEGEKKTQDLRIGGG